jgi:aspartyl-tRNA(Asn)/glutamyl-tRNA(Gln) amidotransferase subunit C
MAGEGKKFRIEDIARIARMQLAESEVRRMEKDLEGILEAFGELDKVDPKCEPSFQPVELKNATRQDVVEPSLSKEDVFSNTEHKEKGFFKGPKTL